jgi:hypothetical protein
MHLLVLLDPQDRIKCAEHIDFLIRADIPDPVTEAALYKILTMVMLVTPIAKMPEASALRVFQSLSGDPRQL